MGLFTDLVDPGKFTVQNLPEYIFLCGGELIDKTRSLRANFYDRIQTSNPELFNKIQLAENADKWYLSRPLEARKIYKDLLELEEYLAGLSVRILLFVESPGAIAELGAFALMPLLREKLIVIIERSHYKKSSFIRNGPIERLLHLKGDEKVFPYPWLSGETIDATTMGDTLEEVIGLVKTAVAKNPKNPKFRRNDHGHLMLLIADLINLNGILSLTDIQKILHELKISTPQSVLKKYISLLEQLDLISVEPYGKLTFYVTRRDAPPYIQYAPKGA